MEPLTSQDEDTLKEAHRAERSGRAALHIRGLFWIGGVLVAIAILLTAFSFTPRGPADNAVRLMLLLMALWGMTTLQLAQAAGRQRTYRRLILKLVPT